MEIKDSLSHPKYKASGGKERIGRRIAYLKILPFLLFILVGCKDDLGLRDLIEEPFTLYGVLSPDLDTQYVWVYPIETFPSLYPAESLEISFVSTDLFNNTQQIWRDSIIEQPNGQKDLLFWAPFRAEFSHTYSIEVARIFDGATSKVEVRIPPPVTISFSELDAKPFEVPLEIDVEGEGIRLLKPEIIYHVKRGDSAGGLTGPDRFYTVSYQGTEISTESGWEISMDLWEDRFYVQGQYTAEFLGGIVCPLLALLNMELHAVVGDTTWDPPGGFFDPNLLSHPQSLTNVENGLGFVGGGYRILQRLEPSQAAVEDACFYYVR